MSVWVLWFNWSQSLRSSNPLPDEQLSSVSDNVQVSRRKWSWNQPISGQMIDLCWSSDSWWLPYKRVNHWIKGLYWTKKPQEGRTLHLVLAVFFLLAFEIKLIFIWSKLYPAGFINPGSGGTCPVAFQRNASIGSCSKPGGRVRFIRVSKIPLTMKIARFFTHSSMLQGVDRAPAFKPLQ